MRWQINHDFTQTASLNKTEKIEKIISAILQNRGLTDPHQKQDFLNIASPFSYSFDSVGLNPLEFNHAVDLIKRAISDQQPIIVYGDYDADGITATAILWETLHYLGAKAIPFIPSRDKHGYGLSLKGLEDAQLLVKTDPLIITVDNGIVAHEAALWLKHKNISLIITDHHTRGESDPVATCIVHSTQISGAGVAWFLSRELSKPSAELTLDLVAIGTIADMMPLLGINRSFAEYGLLALSKSKRPGLQALLKQADVEASQKLSPYHINYIIAPRLNAMGRLEHALDSLRLICTTNPQRAKVLAEKLGTTNRIRQDMTTDLLAYATSQINPDSLDPIIIVEDEKFHEGIIGLIAGKLVEAFYRPAIVISKKDGVSKASARSIKGVNITEIIRSQSQLLLGIGGHPMAAGFSIETEKISTFKHNLLKFAASTVDASAFEPMLEIDCLINESDICNELYSAIKKLEPFGIGNREPVIALHQVNVMTVQSIGKNANHRKITLERKQSLPLPAIWFNPPETLSQIQPGTKVNLSGTINMNTWKNKSSLQIIIKDMVLNAAS